MEKGLMAFGGLVDDGERARVPQSRRTIGGKMTDHTRGAKTFWSELIREDPETALAIARECPRVAYAWVYGETEDCRFWQRSIDVPKHFSDHYLMPECAASVEIVWGDETWLAAVHDSWNRPECDPVLFLRNVFHDAAEAKSACDAKLRELGYLLEDE